jgi:DNA-binding LytR/AlgR family response regulator
MMPRTNEWEPTMSVNSQKDIAHEMFARSAQGNPAVSAVHRHETIVSLETRPEYASDNLEENEQLRANDNVLHGVARIAIKAKGRILFVDSTAVVVAKAQGNYVALVHKSGTHLVRETIATVEIKLTPLGFLRIHRSILVNTTLVKELRRDSKGTYIVRTTDGSEHPVGRAYKSNLKMIASSWLGGGLI